MNMKGLQALIGHSSFQMRGRQKLNPWIVFWVKKNIELEIYFHVFLSESWINFVTFFASQNRDFLKEIFN